MENLFNWTELLIRYARAISRAGAWFGGGLCILASFLVSADVIGRKLFDTPLGMSEISSYVLAVSTSWSLALALLDRAHVRIDALYTQFPTRLCAALDVIALLSFMLFIGWVSWMGFGVYLRSVHLDAHSETPLAVPLAWPELFWIAGFVFFFLTMTALLARALLLLFSGRFEDVQRLLGPRTVQQELEEAMLEHERYR